MANPVASYENAANELERYKAAQAAGAQFGYGGSVENVTTHGDAQAQIRDQMRQNSYDWWTADEAGKAALHAENERLAALLNGKTGSVTYDPTTGKWSGEGSDYYANNSRGGRGNAGGGSDSSYSGGISTPDLSGLLEQWKAAALEQSQSTIDNEVTRATIALQRALVDAQPQFKEQIEGVARDELQSLDNSALYAEARGDRGGIGQSQYNEIQSAAAQNRLAVQQAQTKLSTDTARQIEDLRAQGEFAKADAALEVAQTYLSQLISLEQWASEYNLTAKQFQESVRQWEAEYQLAMQQFLTDRDFTAQKLQLDKDLSYAQFTGQLANGSLTLSGKSQQAQLGEALLSMGVMPSASQLAALGMTQQQAQVYIDGLDSIKPEQLAAMGEALLGAGIMPSAEQLAAMGMTDQQAQIYIGNLGVAGTSQLASIGKALLNAGVMPSDAQLKAMGMSQAQAQTYLMLMGKLGYGGYGGSYSSGSSGGFDGSGGDPRGNWAEGISTQRDQAGMKASAWEMTMQNLRQLLRAGDYAAAEKYFLQVSNEMNEEQSKEVEKLLVQYGY